MIKKNIVKPVVAVIVAMMTISLFACNGSENDSETGSEYITETESHSETATSTENDATTETESETESESESESEETGCYHPYASVPEGHWKPACDVCGKKDGRLQDHEFKEYAEDEGDLVLYSSYCEMCGYIAYEQEVSYDINLFCSAGELVKTATQGLKASYGYDNGVCFTSYTSDSGGGVVFVAKKGDMMINTGAVMAMKVRIPSSQNTMSLAIKSTTSNDECAVNLDYLESGWVTVIVDLSKAVLNAKVTDELTGEPKDVLNGYTPDSVGDFYLEHCALGAKIASSESLDVAWVLFCDTVKVAKEFAIDEKRVYVYGDVMNEDPLITQKPCVDENGNTIEHEIIKDENGHTIESSCSQCGLIAVQNEPHSFVQAQIGNSITYACKVCGWQQFGGNLSKYLSAAEINHSACTYYKITPSETTLTEDGIEYASFTGQGTTAQILFARSNSVSTQAEKAASFSVGQAKYFVIKMRTNTPAVSFAIKFRTALGVEQTLRFPTATVVSGEWAIYVADLSKLIPDAYVPYSNGKYTVTDFYLHIGSADFTDSVRYDIAYMAFFDSWEDMASFADSPTVVSVNGDNAGSFVNKTDKSCVGDHSCITELVGGKYRLVCSVCGQTQKEYDITGNVEKFMPAEQLVGISSMQGTFDRTLMFEDNGDSYVRIDNFKASHLNWGGWNIISDSGATPTGKYMIVKFRIGNNGLSQSSLEFYVGDDSKTLDAGMLLSLSVGEDNEWHTMVIDLSERIDDAERFFRQNADGSYTVRFLQLRPFSKHQLFAQPDDYMDISYIAFCDDLIDIKEVIDESMYEWSVDPYSNSIRELENNACKTHTYTETVSGSLHIISCSICSTEIKRFEIDPSVNWYIDFSSVGIYQHSFEKYLEEDGVGFTRFTGTGGNEIYLTYNSDAGNNVSENKVSTGKYFIIKYRGSSADSKLTLSLQFATGSSERIEIGTQKYADIEHDGWRIAVVDLSACTSFVCNSQDNINIMLRVGGAPTDYVVDVAFAALVDNISEAEGLIADGETYYDHGSNFSQAGVAKVFQ